MNNINKILKLFNAKQKRRMIILFIMMVIGAGFETMGVGLILPIMSVVVSPDSIKSGWLSFFYHLFHMKSTNQFMILLISVLIALYVIKNIFLYVLAYVQTRFICKNQFTLSNRLFQSYVNRPYEYFLNASTAVIIRVLDQDVRNVFLMLTNILNFFTEFFVALFLVVLLLCVDVTMTVCMAVILVIAMMLNKRGLKPFLFRTGKHLQTATSNMSKWLLQTLSGIKEVKVTNKQNYFISQYEKYGWETVDEQRRLNVASQVPRLIIETVSIGGVLGIIDIMLIGGADISHMMTQLSAFAMAAVRLMPSANRMNNYLNGIASYEASLNTILQLFDEAGEWENKKFVQKQEKCSEKKPMELKTEICMENIVFSYPGNEKRIFNHANMKIPVGKAVGIMGPSGAGKTTIVDILLGLLHPSEGKILADQSDVMENYSGWLDKIGYIPQTIYMLDDSILENIAFGIPKEQVTEKRIWEVLREAQMEEFVKELPEGIHTMIGERGVRLSGGQRQRLGIARALYHDPELLVFDEATSALDNETEAAIMDGINHLRGRKTMVIIAHRLGTIRDCDIIYKVLDGKIEQTSKEALNL
jgi:ABC-type multidrug transport system fused ATPase/permease subunit